MATVISTINLKGGVGKTTTTVAIAEMLSTRHRKRVLVIDLDPQTNATTMLIGENRWKELDERDHTLATLFRDAIEGESGFDLDKTLQKGVSNVEEVRRVDLLPSSMRLIALQDDLSSMGRGQFFANVPTDVLRRATRSILDEYDYVLIDCPPNLGLITLNGLRISHGYIIPTIPDVLSTYGITQITSRVAHFSEAIGEVIEPIGIVVCKYRAQSTTHRETMNRLRDHGDLRVFESVIPEGDAVAASAEHLPTSTLRQKYQYKGGYEAYAAVTRELAGILEGE